MKRAEREARYGPIIKAAFEKEGLPGHWGMALARHESDFRAEAQALVGGDLRRGGSFGLCQMSLATARGELGYTGDGEGLKDPELNCAFAARYFRIIMKRFRVNDLANIAAAYNSGRVLARAPFSTRTKYVPLVMQHAKAYEPKEDL